LITSKKREEKGKGTRELGNKAHKETVLLKTRKDPVVKILSQTP